MHAHNNSFHLYRALVNPGDIDGFCWGSRQSGYFKLEKSIEEGDYVMVTGEIKLKNKAGEYENFDYCDIW